MKKVKKIIKFLIVITSTCSLMLACYAKVFSVEQAIQLEAPSVVRTGDNIIMGIDSRDYVSFAPYWWRCPEPNPNNFYYRQDGVRNNLLVKQGDSSKFQELAQAVVLLARAYDKNDDVTKKYIEKSSELIRVWFVDSKTRMNPNLNNAQIIAGPHNSKKFSASCTPRNDNIQEKGGTKSGIIEFRYMISILAVMPIIINTGTLTQDEQDKFNQWLESYYKWLITSPAGKMEAATENNHSTWYDAQAVSIALYLGKKEEAKKRLMSTKDKIAKQISSDGRMINELARAQGLTYSLFNLEAFFILATLAEQVRVDLWKYKADKGQNILQSYEFIKQYKGQCEADHNCKFGPNKQYKQLGTVKLRSWDVLDPANRKDIIYNITS